MRIDTSALIRLIQLARATSGMTIRDCVAKLAELDPNNTITAEEWRGVETGEKEPRAEFAYKVAAVLGFETPIEREAAWTEAPAPKRYHCGMLTDDDGKHLAGLLRELTDFCEAKNIGLVLVTCSNVVRIEVPNGFKEESSILYRRCNLHSMSSTVAPLAQMLMSTKGETQAMSEEEAQIRFDGYTGAIHELVRDSLDKSPAPNAELTGFLKDGPRFKTT